MTESEALEILDLSSTATKEEQQSAFYNLRAGLSEQTKIAPTPMLRERFTKRLSKVYEAQRVLGLKFSEEDPNGIDPFFGDTAERPVENNLPTTDDGKNNLPARENMSLSEDLAKEKSKEEVSAKEWVTETSNAMNEAKFREALKTAVGRGKGKISDAVEEILTLKQLQLDIPETRAIELRKEVIGEYDRMTGSTSSEVETPRTEKPTTPPTPTQETQPEQRIIEEKIPQKDTGTVEQTYQDVPAMTKSSFLDKTTIFRGVFALGALAVLIFGIMSVKDPKGESMMESSVSEAECAPVVQVMFENFSELAPEGDIDKEKMVLIPMLQKECQSGKYELSCLSNVKSIAELRVCKKN